MTTTYSWMVASRRSPNSTVTLADVAREAGVNKGTASRALRGLAGVGESTRERILETARQLDFAPSHTATALATGTSGTIGIVLPTLRSWYFTEVAFGACEALMFSGFRVELVNLDIDSDYLDLESEQFRRLFRELGAGRGRDALLFAGTISAAGDQDHLGSAKVPAQLSGLPLTSVPGIFIDHRQGGWLVGQHLLSLGHRNIAILDGRMAHKADTHVWDQRTEGCLDAIRAAGRDVRTNLIIFPGDCHAEDGVRGMRSILESGHELPSAIFCHTDEMAFGALSVLRQAGMRCPDDVSIASFDGHPMSKYWGLTTVTQHAYEQGVRAASALISTFTEHSSTAALEAPNPPELRVELVVRETTAAR